MITTPNPYVMPRTPSSVTYNGQAFKVMPYADLVLLKYRPGYWYVGTPYSKYPGGLEIAFEDACRIAGYLVGNNVHVYCPIAHTHPVAIHGKVDPRAHNIWLPLDEHFMKGACGLLVVMMPGWEESYGLSEEIKHFTKAGKPIYFLQWPLPLPETSGETPDPSSLEKEESVADSSAAALPTDDAPGLQETVRKFDTGATRSPDLTRDDPEGYLSPLVLTAFCEYMTKHRFQPDGSLRDSDNWQKGIPLDAYMKSLLRHVLHLWSRHRKWPVNDPLAASNLKEDLCAILFNAQGYLHETLKAELAEDEIRRCEEVLSNVFRNID